MGIFYDQVKERLLRYSQIDTTSAADLSHTPTTAKQFDLAYLLKDELQSIGVPDVYLDEEKCVVYGRIPASCVNVRPVGFIAHMDTSPEADGACHPWVLENYDGGDIVLNSEKNIVMSPESFPNLKNYIGQDLVLTDGTTLLGGDDKAAIAEIMTFAQYMISHPEIRHGQISIAFTPDEEVGGLARDLDFERFGSSEAYTIDGDHLGHYEDETFNGSEAVIEIQGRSVHTGTAKGIMKNAVEIGRAFINALPEDEKPEFTEKREGFFHIVSFQGTCEHAVIKLIVRDFDADSFQAKENFLIKTAENLNRKYKEDLVHISITEQYRNPKEKVDAFPFLIRNLIRAIRESGIEPVDEPFRGGTDGASLSWRGLPCPNLSAGYENAHGRFEYVPIQSMEHNVEILIRLVQIYAKQKLQ